MSDFDDVFGEYVLDDTASRECSLKCYKIDDDESLVDSKEQDHCLENEMAPLDDIEYQNRRQELYCLVHWANEAKKQAETIGSSRLDTVTRNYKELQKQFAYLAACYKRVERERDQLLMQLTKTTTDDEQVPSTPSLKEDVSALESVELPSLRAEKRGTKRRTHEQDEVVVVRSKRLPKPTKKLTLS